MKGINNPIGIKSLLPTHNPFIMNAYRFAGVDWATALINWAKRKEITINGASKTATFTDSFASDAWVDEPSSGGDIAVGTNVLDFDVAVTHVEHSTSYDIGTANISETAWTLRWKQTHTTITSGGTSDCALHVGLSSNLASGRTAQNFIGLFLNISTGAGLEIRQSSGSGAPYTTGGTGFTNDPATGTVHYYELKRESATLASLTIYADSEYTEVIERQTDVISTAHSNLRYVRVFNDSDNNGTNTNVCIGTIDDMNFYNNETVVENIPAQQTALLDDDFTSYADTDAGDLSWVPSDTADARVNPTTDVLDFDLDQDGANAMIYYDLGSNLSDSLWILRFKLRFSTLTEGSYNKWSIWLASTSAGNFDSGTGDNLGWTYKHRSSATGGIAHANGNNLGTSSESGWETDKFVIDTDYYVEIKRTSTTSATLTVRTGSYTGTIASQDTQAISSNIIGLRYLKLDQSVTSDSGREAGYIDNVELYDSISEVNPATLTDYPLPIKIIGDADLMEKTTETLDDDFTSSGATSHTSDNTTIGGWLAQDISLIKVNGTNDNMDVNFDNDSTNDAISYDLGSAMSDSLWTLRADMSVTTTATNGVFAFGLSSSDSTAGNNTSQDFLGTRIDKNAATTIRCGALDIDGAVMNIWGNVGDDVQTLTVGDVPFTLYIEIKRLSTTAFKVSIYTDRNYSILLGSADGVCDETVASLRYIKIVNVDDQTAAGEISGTIDNVKFWDGTSNPVNQEVATFTDDFGNDDNWTFPNGSQVNIGSGLLNGAFTTTNAENYPYGYADLTSVSDTTWLLRFKLNTSVLTSPGNYYFGCNVGISDVLTTNVNEDFIGLNMHVTSGGSKKYQYVDTNSSAPQNSGKTDFTRSWTTETVYVQIKRNSSTSYTVGLYSDSDFTIMLEEHESACVDGTSNLRYLKYSFYDISGHATGACTQYIDDVSFWNGISSPNAEGRKIVFTDNAFDEDAVEYASETTSYDPINGDWTGYVKIPSLTTGADTTIQMYYDYTPSATPSYVPEVLSVTGTFTEDFTTSTSEVYNQTGGWAGAVPLSGAGNTRTGIRVESGSSAIGKTIHKIQGELSKSNSPTGTYKWTIRNNADTIVAETPTGVALDLTEAATETFVEFTFDVSRTLVEGDRIQLEFSGGDASNDVNLSYNNGLPSMPSGFKRCVYNGSSYSDTTTGTPYFVTDSTPTWIEDGTAVVVNTSTNVIDWSVLNNANEDGCSYDLTTVSDTNWIVDFDITYDTVTTGSSTNGMYLLVCLDTVLTVPNTVGHDALGVAFEIDNTPSNNASIATFSCDNLNLYDSMELATPTGTISIFTETAQASETHYVRMIRDGATFTVYIYSDITRQTLIESKSVDANDNGTVSGLRYFRIATTRDNTNDHTFDGTIDNVKFWNNINSFDREPLTWNSNYKAVHHLQGNSLDSTFNGNDGTDTAVVYEQQNNSSVGAVFNGSTSGIDCGSDLSLDDHWAGGGHLTVWMNPSSDGEANAGSVMRRLGNSIGWFFSLHAESGGFVKMRFLQEFTTTYGFWFSDLIIPINELTKFDIYYNSDSVANDPVFVMNGTKVNVVENSTPVGTAEPAGADPLSIGDSSGSETFDGLIRNVKISNVTRPTSEAITSYNAEKSDSDMITAGDENTQ